MTSFTSLLVTPLVCNATSKLNCWDSQKNSTAINYKTKLPKHLIAKQLIKPSDFSLKEAATGGVLQKRCCEKCRKIYRKTPARRVSFLIKLQA